MTTPNNKEKILIVDLSLIGDVLMATPAIRALRNAFPNDEIHLLGVPRSLELLIDVPYIDKLIPFDKKGKDRPLSGYLRIARRLREKRYKRAFILHKSFASALVCFLAGIPERIGYSTDFRGFLLTHPYKADHGRIHIIRDKLDLVRKYGVQADDERMVYDLPEEEHQTYFRRQLFPLLETGKINLIINVGASWETKKWKVFQIQALINMLEVNRFNVILVGGPGDVLFASPLYCLNNKFVNLVGKTTIREAASVFKIADVVVTPDSGPMHLAYAVGAPVISLFGPTDPKICGLIGNEEFTIQGNVNCLASYRQECHKVPCCMTEIYPETVYSKINVILNRRNGEATIPPRAGVEEGAPVETDYSDISRQAVDS